MKKKDIYKIGALTATVIGVGVGTHGFFGDPSWASFGSFLIPYSTTATYLPSGMLAIDDEEKEASQQTIRHLSFHIAVQVGYVLSSVS